MADSVQKNVAVRRASLTARSSKRTSFASSPASYIQSKRAAIDFQILALQAEIKVLDELKGMENDDELLLTSLFEILVEPDSKTMDAGVLSLSLSNIAGGAGAFRDGMATAIESLQNRDDDELMEEQFKELAKDLAKTIGCTSLLEMAQIMVMAVLFEDEAHTHSLSDAMNRHEKFEKKAEQEAFQKASHDERMKSLYKLFDFTHDGRVSFKEVVLGLYKITEDIDGTSKAAVDALLVMEEDDSRSLTFEQFAKLIMNVVAAHPDHVKFEDIADKLTIMASQPLVFDTQSIQHLFAMDQTLRRAVQDMNLKEDKKEELDGPALTPIEQSKAARLFDMWDLDHNGNVSFHELALGLRKFQETTAMKVNIEQSIAIMNKFDANSDQNLDRQEFATFLREFAEQQHAGAQEDSAHAKSAFMDMVDFMIVTTALKENSETEKAYIESLTAGDIYYWGC